MAFNSLFVGPPGIRPKLSTNTDTNHGDTAFSAALLQNLHINPRTTTPTFGFTENNSLTYVATGNPCLDFFFHVVPGTPSSSLIKRIVKAWDYDPLTTLKLVCNLRGVRGTGKSDKERFYIAALWLYRNHPKTLALNVKVFAEFGYYKDLLEILYRLVEGEDARKKEREEWQINGQRKKFQIYARKIKSFKRTRMSKSISRRIRQNTRYFADFTSDDQKEKKPRLPKEVRTAQHKAKIEAERAQAKSLRKEKRLDKAKRAFERYTRDPAFRFLYDSVAQMFADVLKQDMEFLNSGEVNKISLASKWCPSVDSSYDRSTSICENIARRVFPKDSYVEYEGIEDAHYVYRIRDRLRKDVLVPLHNVLEIPEVYMSSNRWEALPYNRVPSVAMNKYKEQFLRHDNERFKGYLEDVKKGDAKIAAGALLPHEIIASLKDVDGGEVAELQWARMVDDMLKKGKLNNCIAVCDVSGSMMGTPMEVCVALGLLISELSEEPWKGKVFTFSADPQIHLIKGDSLSEKTEFVRKMEWGNNTNFQRVFYQILEVAINGGLSDDQMIKRVFVFSDMEFDHASGHYNYSYRSYNWYDSDEESDYSDEGSDYSDEKSDYSDMDCDIHYEDDAEDQALTFMERWERKNLTNRCIFSAEQVLVQSKLEKKQTRKEERQEKKDERRKEKERRKEEYEKEKQRRMKEWETDYQVIERKFREKGYKVPEIVFWNLRDSPATPVPANQNGVALVSGFSKNLAKLFLENGGIIDPVAVMEQAISGELYQKLVLRD